MSDVDLRAEWDLPASDPAISPTPTANVTPTQAATDRRSFGGQLLVWTLCIVGLWVLFRGCDFSPIPDPTPDIVINEPGTHVLFVSGDNLTDGQGQVVASAKIITWCAENDGVYRSLNYSDDLSRMEPIWQKLMEVAEDKLPGKNVLITANKDRRPRVKLTETPESVDTAIRFLEDK